MSPLLVFVIHGWALTGSSTNRTVLSRSVLSRSVLTGSVLSRPVLTWPVLGAPLPAAPPLSSPATGAAALLRASNLLELAELFLAQHRLHLIPGCFSFSAKLLH